MKKFNYLSLIIIIAFFFAVPNNVLAKYKGNGNGKVKKPRLAKTAVDPSQSVVDINNITSWVANTGFHDWVVASSWNGAFPNGTNAGAIFAEGLVWGGQVSDGTSPTIRVNGNTYSSGCSPITRLFRVRPDYKTGNLSQDAADFFNKSLGSVTDADIQQLRDQYAKDWQEWPADKGAPWYIDSVRQMRTDGAYDPTNPHDIPGIPNASQTLFVLYNDANSASLYGSPPIGLQISETYWAYSYSGSLGNVIYKKVDMVYKGTATSASNSKIDSMYIVQWADPDVGNSTDDFAGCDTSLGLGYAYNAGATDAVYQGLGMAPPAIGYDFLQGVSKYTGNAQDSAIFNLKWRKGYKYINPKPMSSYAYFAAGGTWDDPDFTYNGTLQFYNLMRGVLPRPPYPSATPFPTSVADVTPYGTYLLDGDPVAGTGKIDGSVDGPGDRRIMVTNGPISLSLGDTAQVVVALVGGLGNSNVNSITAMKTNDDVAQKVYDLLFKLPSIDPPTVNISQLNKKVILTWPQSSKIENFSDQGYSFEGYEVYQLPTASSSLSDGVLLATYDLKNGITTIYDTTTDANGKQVPVQVVDGKDQGLKRFITVTTDPFRHTELRNGQEYYFAVVSYAYNPTPLLPFHALRSAFVVRTAVPQIPVGERMAGTTGDTLAVTHSKGSSDGNVIPIVVDPSQTTGDTYKVSFDTLNGGYIWNVTDVTTGKVVASKQTNQSGDENYPIVGGVLVKVTGPNPGIKQIAEEDANDKIVDPAVGYAVGDYPLSLGTTGYFVGNRAGVGNGGLYDRSYDRFLYWGTDDVIIDFTKKSLTWDYINEDVHMDQSTGKPYEAPFAVFRRKSPSGDMVRLFAGFWDSDTNGVWNDDGSSWLEPLTGASCYEPIYCWQGYDANGNEISYDPANDAQYAADNSLQTSANTTFGSATGPFVYPYVTATLFAMYTGSATIPTGHKVVFITTKTNSSADEFTFTAPKVDKSTALEKTDVAKINVFPNPYYGYQYRETSRDQHYVTFSHLPGNNTTIRIFDLSGVLVKTIHHDNGKQFDTWNLQNDSGYPVSSGVYVVYVDMPGLGQTKVLKLAVVQEQQILKVY